MAFRIFKFYQLHNLRQMTTTEVFIIFTISHAFGFLASLAFVTKTNGTEEEVNREEFSSLQG